MAVVCACARSLSGQTPCGPTPAYSPCDIIFDLTDSEASAHPNPYLTVDLHGEFRSPGFRTYMLPAFWDGGRRLIIRFTPTEAGPWEFRLTSNIERFNGKSGNLQATASDSPGFVKTANVHHFAWTESKQPHLWMGAAALELTSLEPDAFHRLIDDLAARKFNHLSGILTPWTDKPNPDYFRRLDEYIRYMNQKGITADLMLAGGMNALVKALPGWEQRERYIRYLVARYSGMHVTWQGVYKFEEYQDGRDLLRETGLLLRKIDPYHHLLSTGAAISSSPLNDDGWMDYIIEGSTDDQLGAIDHQLYPRPFVNASITGRDADDFRHRLWNATMDGQYPSALPGGEKQMTVWFDFISSTRHWELEPYFDVDGGRAIALEGVEYIVYIEKPSGPVEVLVEKHGYDIRWFNPATGEFIKEKDFKGEKFIGEAPDGKHDWVLHISREGHKQSMLRSWKFESRAVPQQEVELDQKKAPVEIEQPSGDSIPLHGGVPYAAKIKRQSHATRSMMYLWTGDVARDNQGFRVLGTGRKGTLMTPEGIARNFPAVLHIRLLAMNANGKVYSTDRTYQLTK